MRVTELYIDGRLNAKEIPVKGLIPSLNPHYFIDASVQKGKKQEDILKV